MVRMSHSCRRLPPLFQPRPQHRPSERTLHSPRFLHASNHLGVVESVTRMTTVNNIHSRRTQDVNRVGCLRVGVHRVPPVMLAPSAARWLHWGDPPAPPPRKGDRKGRPTKKSPSDQEDTSDERGVGDNSGVSTSTTAVPTNKALHTGHRVFNFGPGPGALPTEVMQRAQEEFMDWQGCGMGMLEATNIDASGM